MRDLNMLEIYRDRPAERRCWGFLGDDGNGVFVVPSPIDGGRLAVIASSGEGWDHVSVSRANRCPNWPEMEHIKRLFFKPDEVCMQLHVAEAEHISFHPHCLHIWRPQDCSIPLPPAEFVGPKGKPHDGRKVAYGSGAGSGETKR